MRAELTSLVAVLAQLAESDDLGELCEASSDAFGAYVAAGRDSGSRSVWFRPDPALLAAVVPTAVEFLDSSSAGEFDERLAPFVLRGFETRFRFLSDAHGHLGVRGRTMQSWGRVLGRRVHLTTRLRARYVGPEEQPDGLASLPQLLWPDVFERRFARFLPDVRSQLRRRFCSLTLGVLATKGSYLDVAAGLGLARNDSLGHHLGQPLRDGQEDGDFYDALVEAAEWLGDQRWTVDYGARRRVLGDLTLITPEDWAWACWASGVYVDRGRRRRHSSTWIWCVLTGGEQALALTFRGRDRNAEKASYGRFLREHLATLEPALVALATRSCNAGACRARCVPTCRGGGRRHGACPTTSPPSASSRAGPHGRSVETRRPPRRRTGCPSSTTWWRSSVSIFWRSSSTRPGACSTATRTGNGVPDRRSSYASPI